MSVYGNKAELRTNMVPMAEHDLRGLAAEMDWRCQAMDVGPDKEYVAA